MGADFLALGKCQLLQQQVLEGPGWLKNQDRMR